jgi:hypothetical protein
MKRIDTLAVLILILSTVEIFSQTPDTSDFFPYKTGNMWEYFFDAGGPDMDTVQTFTISDSVDAEGFIYITQFQRNINPTTWTHTFYYKIDTLNNYVYGSSGLGTDNDLLFKLDAQLGDQWVVYKHQIGSYEMARVGAVEEDNFFGINTKLKVFYYYGASDTTDTLGLSRGANALAGGFGLSFGGGGDAVGDMYLIGAVINGVLYGDTTKIITSIFDTEKNIPKRIHLYQNYPNPFNPNTTIEYELPHEAEINISIYDVLGQQINILYDGLKPAGTHKIQWNGSGFTSGIYICRLQANENIMTIKMLLLS